MKKIDEIVGRYLIEKEEVKEAEPGNRKKGESKKFAVQYIVRSTGKTKTLYVHADSASDARQKSVALLKKFKSDNPEAAKMNWSFESTEEV